MSTPLSFEARSFDAELLPTPGVPVITIILFGILTHLRGLSG